jgi:hypothetical protein
MVLLETELDCVKMRRGDIVPPQSKSKEQIYHTACTCLFIIDSLNKMVIFLKIVLSWRQV